MRHFRVLYIGAATDPYLLLTSDSAVSLVQLMLMAA